MWVILVIVLAFVIVTLASKYKQSGGSSISANSVSPSGESTVILREQFRGGYSKEDVLTRLDFYTNLLSCLENGGISNSDANDQYIAEKYRPISMAHGGSGFNIEDVNAYIAKLQKKIENKINGIQE
ncbi:MAG: hypothetical protein IJM38_06550 [Ruminococcus sp.]|nr:hypothetical protein [Ruminococcus sp.]